MCSAQADVVVADKPEIGIMSMTWRIPIVLFGIGAFSAAVSMAGCGKRDLGKGDRMAERSVEQVQEAHTDEWMAIPGVEGVAIGLFEDKPCIKILSSKKAEELRARIPSLVEGYPVIIEETGTFRALERQ
jgi:hypothetical protein